METHMTRLEDLREIRRLMEKSSRFLSLSGLSGIFAGIFALLGAGIAYWHINRGGIHADELYRSAGLNSGIKPVSFFIVDAGLVLGLTLVAGYYFSVRKARRMGVKFWNLAARRMIVNLFIPLITGGLVIIILLVRSQVSDIAPFMLIFYGLGLIGAGKYSYSDINYLGLLEILLGILSLVFINHGLLFWTIGFGVLHLIYGTILYYKYDRVKEGGQLSAT